MRPVTWQTIESTPVLHRLYRIYRRLPDAVRSPMRWLTMPRWQLATFIVRAAAANTVVAGPFRGMALNLSPLSKRHLPSYILGSTELELRGVVERILSKQYANILNIGAADGYYAVGLAARSPKSRVVAYEAQAGFHPTIERAAHMNGVSQRISIKGFCDQEALCGELHSDAGPTLVVMDIEGAEHDLLDPCKIASLRNADILVETHDAFAPGCTNVLMERFAATHWVERFVARPRTLADYPIGFLNFMPRFFPQFAVDMMDERRAEVQQWLYLVARSASSHDDRGNSHDPSHASAGQPAEARPQ